MECFDERLFVRRVSAQPVAADLIGLQIHLGAHQAVKLQGIHFPTMTEYPDRSGVIRAAQVNDRSAGTLLHVQLPPLRKRTACGGLIIPRRPALLVGRHKPVAGGLEGGGAGVLETRPDLLRPQMVETLIEILWPVFPRRGKDGGDAQRQTKTDDLAQDIRMGVRALEARIIVELGIGRTAVPPPVRCHPLTEPFRAQGGTNPGTADRPHSARVVNTSSLGPAFSGSHQDAIKKGLAEWNDGGRQHWDVPYLAIDPADIGREYREVIRVNSQSGKGGVAYLLESEFGIELPKDMQREFGPIANEEVDRLGREVSGAELKAMFWREYVERALPWQLEGFETESRNGAVRCRARLLHDGKPVELSGEGNGPLAALVHGFSQAGVPRFEIANYSEHALSAGEEATAIAYIQLKHTDSRVRWGAGVDTSIELASIRAVLSALNRS